MSLLKDDLSGLKSKLLNIEGEFENKLKEVENKESKFKKIDEQIDELVNKKDSVIKLNVGGKIYQTKISTLLSVKDTLFTKIVSSALDNNETITELFFDRSFDHFHIILDYLRTKQFNPKGMKKWQIDEMREECEYYGIGNIEEVLAEMQKEVEFINWENSGRYSTAGTHNLADLKDRTMMKGICVQSPYFITIEFNYEHEFEEIEVGGWGGNTSLWYPGNGANAQILTSKDKVTWVEIGKLPSTFTNVVTLLKVKKTTAKYIKFQHNSYLGLGFLNIIRSGVKK
jgi:soluble cytochrome b562